MLGFPRIVAIDDQPEHLTGIADCLNRSGVVCLRVHFTRETAEIPAALAPALLPPAPHKMSSARTVSIMRAPRWRL